MTRKIFGKSVKGASHKRNDIVCQDQSGYKEISDDIILLAVADGHGSEACLHSESGALIAVNTFIKTMEDLIDSYKDNLDLLPTYLNREGETKIAKVIDDEWKTRIKRAHTRQKRDWIENDQGKRDYSAVYKQYGTTLVGLMITPDFVFALQIGDGDIAYIDKNGTQPFLEGDKILGVETHSLCKEDAWKKAISTVRMHDCESDKPYMYMLSSDGFSNSYKSQEDYNKTCFDYFEIIKEHGLDVIEQNLEIWLNETSEFGCGDDITVMMVYYE